MGDTVCLLESFGLGMLELLGFRDAEFMFGEIQVPLGGEVLNPLCFLLLGSP